MKIPKVALIHDWLTGMRGGEKCLEILCELFPQADIYTLIHKKGSVSGVIEKQRIVTSFLQKIPNIFQNYRNYLPLFPIAIESFNFSKYNLIISTSHCIAKGVKKNSSTYHLCYCFTPMRYAWTFFEEYFGSSNFFKKSLINIVLSDLRRWDINSNKRVNDFISISAYIQKRIKHCYNLNSEIIYPPVDTEFYNLGSSRKDNFYLIVSALVPYKKVDLAIKVCNGLKKKLVIVGTGPCENELKKIANPEYIEFLGWQTNEEIRKLYQEAKALIFPGEEDFGIVPVETQSCGCPVIAYNEGGATETVIQDATGVFFKEQNEESLIKAIEYFEDNLDKFKSEQIRLNALKFDKKVFKENMYETILQKYTKFINA